MTSTADRSLASASDSEPGPQQQPGPVPGRLGPEERRDVPGQPSLHEPQQGVQHIVAPGQQRGLHRHRPGQPAGVGDQAQRVRGLGGGAQRVGDGVVEIAVEPRDHGRGSEADRALLAVVEMAQLLHQNGLGPARLL